jgi:hypothetical protein
MKLNLFALGRAVRALIITVIGFCLIGMIFCPELVSYSPENAVLFCAQLGFARASLFIGLFSAGLFYWEATRE